ncbi:MAG: acid phosphatase type 7, partial [Solirubrobacteraceae bacterium]|nr:acid phosphatase type 7 [Solirubrobacteraceae bacterium]
MLVRYGGSGRLGHSGRGPRTVDRVRRLVTASVDRRFRCLAVLVGVLVAFPPDDAGGATSTLRRYPYLTDVSGTNATVNWATSTSATTGSLRWGAAAADGSCSPTSTATATRASITVNGVAEYQWKASFAAQRSTTYCYRVLLGATDLLGTDATPTFATAAGAGSSSSTFAVFGDWGKVDTSGANQDQANVMRQLARSGAQFAISTGDVPYGATGVASESQYGDLFTAGNGLSAVFGPLFWTVPGRSLPLFPT